MALTLVRPMVLAVLHLLVQAIAQTHAVVHAQRLARCQLLIPILDPNLALAQGPALAQAQARGLPRAQVWTGPLPWALHQQQHLCKQGCISLNVAPAGWWESVQGWATYQQAWAGSLQTPWLPPLAELYLPLPSCTGRWLRAMHDCALSCEAGPDDISGKAQQAEGFEGVAICL